MIFWLGLFAGLIIGWVVEWVIDWRFWRREQPVDLDEESRLRRELETARLEINRLQSQLASPPPTETTPTDDLQDIKGIGQVFAKRLNDAGIYTFVQLSQLSPERLHEIIQPQEWQSIDFAAWITQARTLTQKSHKGT
jgi:predicted flap endonuclease-1-like 5' DNA nuclease